MDCKPMDYIIICETINFDLSTDTKQYLIQCSRYYSWKVLQLPKRIENLIFGNGVKLVPLNRKIQDAVCVRGAHILFHKF